MKPYVRIVHSYGEGWAVAIDHIVYGAGLTWTQARKASAMVKGGVEPVLALSKAMGAKP